MPKLPHTALYTDQNSHKRELAQELLQGRLPAELEFLTGLKGALFSNVRLEAFLEEEARHDRSEVNPGEGRALRTYSSGERKKALLRHILKDEPEFLILDNPFDNMDRSFQKELRDQLEGLSDRILLLQFISRNSDILPCIQKRGFLKGVQILGFPDYIPQVPTGSQMLGSGRIPSPPSGPGILPEVLVRFKKVSVHYGQKPVVKDVDWEIRQGDFWELRGPNGSGKSTLITMITGDNPKAYGQQIECFGKPKGSGESVWDIKEQIGYFTPAMTDRFRGYHSLEHMIISGLTDSIGLYTEPTELQIALAKEWLEILGLQERSGALLCDQSPGIQRLVFCARAMVKHPPLLILDEPTAGLDDRAAALVVALIRKMAGESRTAIVFVSHREEEGLDAKKILELIPGSQGSVAQIIRLDT